MCFFATMDRSARSKRESGGNRVKKMESEQPTLPIVLRCLAFVVLGTFAAGCAACAAYFLAVHAFQICRQGDMGCGIAAWGGFLLTGATGALIGATTGLCASAELVQSRLCGGKPVRVRAVIKRLLFGLGSMGGILYCFLHSFFSSGQGWNRLDIGIALTSLGLGFYALRVSRCSPTAILGRIGTPQAPGL